MKFISIDPSLASCTFIRSSGPGGQNVNKLASAVQLRYRAQDAGLPQDIYHRLLDIAGTRASNDGEIVITARRFRSQEKNRTDAYARLQALLDKAAVPPRKRRPTKPKAAAKARRLDAKKRQSMKKAGRRTNWSE